MRRGMFAGIWGVAAIFGALLPAAAKSPFSTFHDPEPVPSKDGATKRHQRHARRRAARWFDPEHQAAVNRLTNWQRHQWVKAGRRRDRLAAFAALPHWKKQGRPQRLVNP